MRIALQQIYINLFVEYGSCRSLILVAGWALADSALFVSVVKNPLSPTEHPGGVGVNNELFEESLEQFVVRAIQFRHAAFFVDLFSDMVADSSSVMISFHACLTKL